ncbi:uncharacterized protein KIAA0513 [Frankliniella occidentalis]|uniref:Uncharacterized protein KIAA0513 n=1 Tax=Frankliniella occidentalis TaxID=133901 RepID=A0A9C6U211_FRAOC|nr:uncharacterized protein KIAA0513 [Frankliniella occidentalis]
MVDLLPLKQSVGALRVPRAPLGPPPGPSAPDGQLGLLKSRLFSALESLEGSQILSNLSSRLETALSLSQDNTSSSPSAACSARSPDEPHASVAEDKRQPAGSEDSPGGAARPRSSACSGADRGDAEGAEDPAVSRPAVPQACGPDPYEKLHYKMEAANSSSSGSEGDGYGPSTSIDSPDHDAKYWVRSGSEGSVRSWASSLSLDSQSDEATAAAVEFMRKYVADLFGSPVDISLEQKAKFGQLAQMEAGRLWFARFVNAQRVHNLRVSESTFYSLVQHFAIVLFECADADDFGPSKSLMNMCFTFYHEVDVPGCEPYKEYLSVYLREQPIWHSLRFWNAALFDALQCERQHGVATTLEAVDAEQEYQENVTFGQLGTFTCNMHAFGLSRELCTEFLRKQCVIANLREDQEKMLRDNVERMYSETERWRSP